MIKTDGLFTIIQGRWGKTAVITLLALFTLTGCVMSSLQGNQETAAENATITVELQCTQACAERGQCGAAQDGSDRVLLSSQPQPVVEGHDIAIVQNARAVVLGEVVENLELVSTGDPVSHTFYRVQIDGTETIGWVAQWCAVPVN